jgi:prevent-host-death family protein
MTTQVNVYEAKTRLSKLLEQVEAGEDVVIARNGKPIAQLIPVQRRREPRVPGAWKGKGWIADDFKAPDPELEDLFYNGPIFPEDPSQPVDATSPKARPR